MGKSTKTTFIVGDRVVFINLGPLTGLKGEVVEIKGLFKEKYVVEYAPGKKSVPVSARFLAKDKRNN